MTGPQIKPEPLSDPPAKVILVGNPNVGKSVIFNYLTGAYRVVSNYPGTTVEVSSGSCGHKDHQFTILDTPGINNLSPNSEDEKVTRDILLAEENYTVLSVLDAKNLNRGLTITLQLIEMGLPLVLVLNMVDEAKSRGIEIQHPILEEILGVKVLPAVATRKKGLDQILPNLLRAKKSTYRFTYSALIEEAVEQLAPLIPPAPISGRSLALMLLSGDETLRPWLEKNLEAAAIQEIEKICVRTQRLFPEPIGYRINVERLEQVEALLPRFLSKASGSRPGLGAAFGGPLHPPGVRLDRSGIGPLPFLLDHRGPGCGPGRGFYGGSRFRDLHQPLPFPLV